MLIQNLFSHLLNTGSLSGVVSSYNPLAKRDLHSFATGINNSQSLDDYSFAFENVAAQLTPFQYPNDALVDKGHPLHPTIKTKGVIFPYTPSITEGVNVKYDSLDLTHSNESYHSYKGTENVRINLTDCIWTCDTFQNAVYALSVLHFFRSYSLMDFGRNKSGMPPSPMWFSAYGKYGYNRVPVLLESANWSFPNDIDYVGIPDPHSDEYRNGQLLTNRNNSDDYTWMPTKFVVSLNLIVQHSPEYWTNFSLDDYYSGNMLKRGKTFHSKISKKLF